MGGQKASDGRREAQSARESRGSTLSSGSQRKLLPRDARSSENKDTLSMYPAWAGGTACNQTIELATSCRNERGAITHRSSIVPDPVTVHVSTYCGRRGTDHRPTLTPTIHDTSDCIRYSRRDRTWTKPECTEKTWPVVMPRGLGATPCAT